jgi:hypothetical protein
LADPDVLDHRLCPISPSRASNVGSVRPVGGIADQAQGALAQLVARFHGMEEVRGSSPLSSTHYFS